MNFDQWIAENQPSEQMNWKGAFYHQQARMEAVIKEVGANLLQPPDVPAVHHSKSIMLPVLHLKFHGVDVYIRDNFHDVNVCFLCVVPPQIPVSEVHEKVKDWAWYLEEIGRSRGYTYRGWTDAEMEDPRILRVQVTGQGGHTYWSEVNAKEKDRWIKRLSDPAWYSEDWSSGELIVEGDMGPDCKMYRAPRAFMQGISEVVPEGSDQAYVLGRSNFTVVTGWERVAALIRLVANLELMATKP